MEENLNEDPLNNGDFKKKKSMGPLKGLLLAILVVFLICVIGLLIRMVVVGDGDYFKPIKDIFGIEGKKEDTKAPVEQKVQSVVSGQRYTLLNSKEEAEDVKHYRFSVDPVVLASKLMDVFGVEGRVSTEEIGGDVYLDIFANEDEFVGLVLGYDYLDMLEEQYNQYVKDPDMKDMLKEEGIDNLSDFVEMFESQIDIDKDEIIDEMFKDDETVEKLNMLGISKKDIDEAINLVKDNGLLEVYVYGTEKFNELVSGEYNEQLEQIGNDLDTEYEEEIPFDFDINQIDEIADYINDFIENKEYEDYGIEISEIN